MTNNGILRRLRYVFDFDDSKMIEIFAHADRVVTRAEICNWLKKDDEPSFEACPDVELASFLNGLIIEKRGKSEPRTPEAVLTNNIILTKLKIALALKSDDIMAILGLAGYRMSAHELTALHRKPGHKHFRKCQDQMLRNFLHGLQLKYRPSDAVLPTQAAIDENV